ncbi:MAG: RidA family protein [candidate division Zixibacteria bacterium]|nr:RidA family protein [candidate division Zixibacteria bacterium]
MKKTIATDRAPKAIGPYSQGVVFEKLVFVSGQIPIDPATGELVGGSIENQAHRVFKNIEGVLKAAGSDLSKVLKVVIFLKNMDDFAKINKIYTEYFKEPFPARAVVEISRLPKDAIIEADAIAYN